MYDAWWCMIMYANSESADVLTLSLIVKPNEVRPHINAMLRPMPSHAIAYASVHQLLWPNRVPLEDSPPAHGNWWMFRWGLWEICGTTILDFGWSPWDLQNLNPVLNFGKDTILWHQKIWFVDTAFTTFEGRLAYRFAMRTSEILPLRRVCQVSINTFGVGGTFATQFYLIRALPFNWEERSSIWTELTAQLSALSGVKVGLMHCFHTANWVADYMTSPSSRSSSKIIEVGLECVDTHKKESKERWYDEFLWLYIPAIGGSWPWCQIENRNLPHLQVPVCSTRTMIYPNQYGEIPLSHPIILVGKWPSPLLWFRNVYIYIIYPRGPRFSDGEAVGLGGVGWGMVASCYVAATFMGGVGWGMVASCYVAATFMGGVGWGGAW